MDLRKLKTLLDLFENSNLMEMEFSEGEEKIRLSKASSVPAAAPVVVRHESAEETGAINPAQSTAAEAGAGGTVVKSPMVGTFYRSSAPDRPPFVRVGQKVDTGETLCIVEAMKLMNEIPSPVAGTVKEIIAENGEGVSWGATLFIIE